MTAATLKKKLHEAIEGIDDKDLLDAVFTIINKSNAIPSDYYLSDEDLRIIEERKHEYKRGKSKVYTVEEVKKKRLKNIAK